jgi:hypothetical protein
MRENATAPNAAVSQPSVTRRVFGQVLALAPRRQSNSIARE